MEGTVNIKTEEIVFVGIVQGGGGSGRVHQTVYSGTVRENIIGSIAIRVSFWFGARHDSR